ncbi:MAG: dipeptidase [Gemmataceae bacterium]
MRNFVAVAVGILGLFAWADEPRSRGKVEVTEAALAIHRDAILVDGHNDLPWELRAKSEGAFLKVDIARPQPKLHTDIARLRKGGVGAQFWSAYVPAESAKKGKAVTQTLEQIDTIHRMIAQYPETFAFAGSVDEIYAARAQGKIASMIGIEGGHSIDNSLGALRCFYRLGVRYMTLTHSDTLDWADSATDAPKSHGLSPFGEQVVEEMNRLGMLVDISHVSVETMKHAIRVSKAPVIASHSSAFAIAAHPRNVPDDVLVLVRDTGGVVMINFFSGFIVPEGARAVQDLFPAYKEMKEKYKDEKQFDEAWGQWKKEHPIPRGTVHNVVDHIEHVIKVAGIDNVGLGSDFDGIGVLPEQLDDVSCYPVITQELLNRGYNAEQIKKVLGGNLLRVFRKAEEVSKQLKSAG